MPLSPPRLLPHIYFDSRKLLAQSLLTCNYIVLLSSIKIEIWKSFLSAFPLEKDPNPCCQFWNLKHSTNTWSTHIYSPVATPWSGICLRVHLFCNRNVHSETNSSNIARILRPIVSKRTLVLDDDLEIKLIKRKKKKKALEAYSVLQTNKMSSDKAAATWSSHQKYRI